VGQRAGAASTRVDSSKRALGGAAGASGLTRRRSLGLALVAGVVAAACSPQQLAEERGAKRRLSVATGGTGGVYYPYGGGVAKIISESVRNVEATAEVTSASVDNLKFLRDGKADIAFTLADTLDDAYKGEAAFKEFGKVPAHALAVLYANYTHVVTLADKGIDRIADLKNKVVSTGSAGSGTEVIAFRMLEAAGLKPASDVQKQGLGVAQSVDALKDGKIDAFFWSGGLPTAAVLDLANTPRLKIKLLPNDDVLPALQKQYGANLYYKIDVPKTAYPGLDADVPVVGVANVLVVHEKMSEALAYDVTRVLFDKQAELVAIHPEAKKLTLESAVVGSPVPFHRGAIRYYREKKVWKG
jgi:TRAP transporter TAXI family solute receptor